MSTQHELRVEYVSSPSSVECTVPHQQLLRQPVDDVTSSENGGNQSEGTKNENSTFVPVYNMRVEEAAFTKGDQKLQKVTVTENISDNNNKIFNPAYSEVHGEVIQDQQPLRIPKDDGKNDEDSEAKKPRSRIPKLRQAAEKFKQDRKAQRENEFPTSQPRRSSIPKLRRAKIPSSKDTENTSTIVVKSTKENNNNTKSVENNDKKNNLPPEEEFDKMFDDIIQNNEEPVLDSNIVVNNPEEAEKLEHSFDELMHDYEENKIKPIDVDEIKKNRMLLAKRKSLPDQVYPKKLERRSSLKDIEINDCDINPERKVSKLDEIKKRFNMINRKASHGHTNAASENETEKIYVESCTNGLETCKINYEKPIIKESKEEVVSLRNHREMDPEHNTKQNAEVIEQPNILDFEKERAEQVSDKLDEYVVKNMSKDGVQGIKSRENKDTPAREEHNFTLPPKEEFYEDLPNKNTVISRIALFGKKIGNGTETDKVLSKPDIKYTVLVSSEDLPNANINIGIKYSSNAVEDTEEIPRNSLEKLNINKPTRLRLNINSTPPNTPQVHDSELYEDSVHLAGEPQIINIDVDDDDDINKEFASNQNNVYKSLISNESKTPKHRSHKPKLSARDVYNQIDNSKSPNIDFESPNTDDFNRAPFFEAYNKKIITEAENKEIDLPLQGKVSKIINRIALIEKSAKHDPKAETSLEIPIKKSVSSRIAIFERQASNPPESSKPKIIEEVLKTQPPRHTTFEDGSNSFQSNELQVQKGSGYNETILMYENKEHIAQVVEVQDITVGEIKEDVLEIQQNAIVENEQEKEITPKIPENTSEKYIQDREDRINIQKNSTKESKYNKNHLSTTVKEKEIITSTAKNNSETYIQEREERAALVKRVQDRLNNAKSFNESRNFKKGISTVELDLGDSVKGKVNSVIIRMKSVENLEPEKKHSNINIRERPRKKSVSDKIALFEKMLSSVEMTTPTNGNSNGYENGATVATTPKTTNTSPRNYHNVFVTTDQAVCKDETSTKATEHDNIAIGATPEMKMKMTSSDHNENVLESKNNIEMTNTVAIDKMKDDVVTSTSPKPTEKTTPEPRSDEYYQRRIKDLQEAPQKYGRVNMTSMKLKNGHTEMPVLVLGTALLDPILLPHVIPAAIEMGYRAIDTAYIYGNEKEIGDAIRAKITDGTVKREDLFIIGKLWSTFHRQDLVEKACRDSLQKLGLEYFDMYLVHNPMSFKEDMGPLPMIANVLQYSQYDYMDAWYGMEGLVRKDLAKNIGVSNFNSQQIERVVDKSRIKPVVNMVECHPYLNQQRLDQWCADRNVSLMCYGTLGSKGTPAEFKSNQDSAIDDALVRTLAAGLNISPAQLLIRYQLECGHVVVTKCTSAANLWDNLQALNIRLTTVEVDALNAIGKNKRTYTFIGMGDTHRNYPFKIPF